MVKEKEKEKSRILLLQDIEDNVAGEIIKRILEINAEDSKALEKNADYVPEPIVLVINSLGGSVYDGLGLIGAIESSETPVHTVCYGSAMSMALFILAAGHYRIASKYSTLMYHELSTEVSDKLSGIKSSLEECKRLENLCDTILVRKTKFKQKEFEIFKKKKDDWFFTPALAKKKGLIDEII